MFKKNQIVRFRVGEEYFGIDITRIHEIVTVPDITKVPDSPAFLEGIINLRGKIVSVVDLRKRLKLNAIQRNKKSRILVTDINNKIIGLIVDEVSEVLRIDPESIELPPELVSSFGARYINAVVKLENSIVLLLDLDRLLSADEAEGLADSTEPALAAGTFS